MSVFNEFRTDTHLNQIYRGRQEYERVRAVELGEQEDTRAERDAERAAKEVAVAAEEAALQENARLTAELVALRARAGPARGQGRSSCWSPWKAEHVGRALGARAAKSHRSAGAARRRCRPTACGLVDMPSTLSRSRVSGAVAPASA
ncbi:MAG: hypothetical protein EXR69_15930 [Myxococcales bacterium]|nr:hypothetical protein [Myxococcales bacterium]